MTYQEVLDYLFQQFPQYQKIGGSAYKPGLDNIIKLCDHLGNLQNELKFVHVAGTNGKGSTCSMLASILKEAGYKVGLFTSPHLVDFSERIRINGEMISQEAVVAFVAQHKDFFDTCGASFFEWSLALALDHFNNNQVDIVILETGLGGRLDATNIVTPILSVITSISIDHTQYLGTTIHEIAKEKAGIIKDQVPVVTTISNPVDALEVINEVADDKDCSIYMAVADDEYPSDLKGGFQQINKGVVLKCLDVLEEMDYKITQDAIERGFLSVRKNAGLRGRWETLQENPHVIADIGHNLDGVTEVVRQLENESYDRLLVVWGMVEDKEIGKVVEVLPKDATYYLAAPAIKRAMPVDKLAEEFDGKLSYEIFSNVPQAYDAAVKCSNSGDLILVGGSNFVVAEIISDFF
ncbi:MAG: bifunctional folylpolyglutamate synthase/dihydrofolate synthase [Flavobacteriales bacterium]|nr:bifunctional folylpolyglutamate synthase/dihydrofolate synthase [Flavobacteriales bacterium]